MIRLGHHKILGKRAWTIDSNAVGLIAEVTASGETVPASSTNYVSLAGYDHAGMEIDHVAAYRIDNPNELVTDLHRHRYRALGPGVPFVNMDIGTAA